ncbi:hypothetical protein BJV82DRAFT_715928 [Fennellomyces sp. T-0311]|nr:hypothetical protein BJV82DRAFT_715928 [Fennellomyces sp. T-0311]
MSNSESGSSLTTGSMGIASMLTSTLHIPGYHFKAGSIRSLAHGENTDIIYGYRISSKSAVVAKVSTSSQRFEREYYVMKKLYHYRDGKTFVVRPLELHVLPTGLSVAIYADEGHSQQYHPDDYFSPKFSNNGFSTEGYRSWIRQVNSKGKKRSGYGLLDQTTAAPTYDLYTFLRFAIKCTNCLDYIHKFGVVHNEIRLSSFQWDGTDGSPVKLWNFGSGPKSFETYLTSEGWRRTAKNKELVGILQSLLVYMSPEQTGRTTYIPDHRSDIYSLGIVFFILLTGRNPYDGGPLDIINGILSRKIALVHELQLDVPEILSRIIEKMTSKAPDDRYSSARGVRHDLKECLKRLNMAGDEPSAELIPSFPLAQNDIASVFTLPKHIYGRQDTISHMQFLIERCASLYKVSVRRTQSKATPTGTPISGNQATEHCAEEMNDACEHESNGDSNSSSTRYCNSGGFDGSDVSSATSLKASKNGKAIATVVGLYGPGGIGKSTLLSTVQQMARRNGYIAVGKFDSRNKVPYITILKSLSQILQQILAESEEEIKMFYQHLRQFLGTHFQNISLLIDFIPELKPLLRAKENTAEFSKVQMDNIELRTRFHKVFVEVIRAITHWRMITLFLDDLHQADDPSLELMESLIMARVNILVFISYRDQEITAKLSQLLQNKIADMHLIKIDALSMDPLIDFICDTLHRPRDSDRESIIPLANIIFRKTQGNAFYTTQLMQTLERKKLIYFNWEKNAWDYGLREIEEASIFDHANMDSQLDVSFMIARLRELSPAGQSFLKWASYVGDTFTWETVKSLMISEGIPKNTKCTAKQRVSDDDESSITSDAAAFEASFQPGITFSHPATADDSTSTSSSHDSDSVKNIMDPSVIRSSSYQMDTSSSSPTTSHSGDSTCDPISGLQAVLHEGYIMPLGGDEFKWCHDRISQAAGELADPGMRKHMHLTIAQHLMNEEVIDSFLIADHLLKCQDILFSMEDKHIYREVMIEAGSKGQSAGAHSMAFAYYMCAITLGDPQDEWDDGHFDATLRLYTNAAALSWVAGEHEKTEGLLETVLQNARKPLDRVPAYRIQASFYFACQMHEEGCDTLLRCLDELGDERARMDISDEALAREFDQAEKTFEQLGEEGVLNLKVCDDDVLKASLGVMDEMVAASYWSNRKRELFYWACRVINISLEKGPTSSVGSACMTCGLGYAHLFKKYAFAERLARAGLALADKYANAIDKGRAYCLYPAFALHWKYHQKESFYYINTAMDLSTSAGDRIYGAFCLVWTPLAMFFTGYNLNDTLREAEASFEDIHSWSPTVDHNSLIMCIIRSIKALQGQTYIDTPNVFDGDDGFNDTHFLSESCKHTPNPELPLNWYESFKMIPLTLYGHVDTAIQTGYRCFETIDGHPCHRHGRMMLFYFSLALVEKIRHGDKENCQKYLNQVKINQKLIYEWAVHTPINYLMYWTLVEAELVGLEKPFDISTVSRLYDNAIDQARAGSWYLELCVIHEYAGAFYERVGLRNFAYGFIKKSIELYTCHGSYGKAQHVSTKFSSLLCDFDDTRRDTVETGIQTDPMPFHQESLWSIESSSQQDESRPNSNILSSETYTGESIPPVSTEQTLMTLDILDMASILKSSQVMSSEVKFDSLLTSMMNIVLENSGADCGAVIIKDDKYGICAYGSQQASTTTFDPPKRLSDDDKLVPSRVVNHTIHTGESIFIHNIEHDPRFAVGPWFERTGGKSVICMPISHKCNIVGCLLIEGTVGVFTQRHVTVLGLLCQQMGISITNAFLFKSVQRVTMANMRMIEMQKQALEDARKSKEAADRATRLREIFLANMSHEIRTPFSGFYGMISLLAETKLDSEQRDLVHTAKESCEMLLRLIDDLLNFSKLQAGKVSLDVSPVIVENVIADVVEMLIAMAIKKRINITYTVAPEVPSVVMADGNRLRQVIINLLGNAIKFTHQGEIKLRCFVKENYGDTGSNGDKIPLLFEVIDSGIGISDEQRKVLFLPFSQVDGSTTRKYGGTGLGLSICMQLVKLMCGTINVTSVPSQGSNFHFSICVSQARNQKQKRDTLATGLLRELGNSNVIVIDNHASTVNMIQALLPGIPVDGACSIDEVASRKADNYSFVIIGFLLAHDPNFSSWAAHIHQILAKTRCVVIMHYPIGAIGSTIRENQLIIEPKNSTADHNGKRTPSAQSTTSPVTIKTTTGIFHSTQQRAIVRIAIPLRRITLLKVLVDMLHQTTAPPHTPRPALAAQASAEGRKFSQEYVTSDERARYKTLNLLAAEDNPVAQKLLYKQLTRLGFKVVCANNGLEAVEAWKRHPPGYFAMAFFDHHMPKCDGVEAAKTIRKIESEGDNQHKRLPIVTLTADIQDSARKVCMNAGMDDYLTKPMNHQLLAEILRRYCCKEAH